MKGKMFDICDAIYQKDSRYKPDAYEFVLEALSYTQKIYKCPKHVSGPQLLEGLKELALEKFGPMSLTVLKHWGIHTTDDFGNIVFNMIEKRILTKTEEDNIENFKDVYDFSKAFPGGYRCKLAKTISRLR